MSWRESTDLRKITITNQHPGKVNSTLKVSMAGLLQNALHAAATTGVDADANGREHKVHEGRLNVHRVRTWMQAPSTPCISWFGLAWWAAFKVLDKAEGTSGSKGLKQSCLVNNVQLFG